MSSAFLQQVSLSAWRNWRQGRGCLDKPLQHCGLQDFLRNNRGINDGGDVDSEFMEALYLRIVNNEIKMKVRPCLPHCLMHLLNVVRG